MYFGIFEKKDDVREHFDGYGCGYGSGPVYGHGDLTEEFKTVNILLAWYDYQDYDGSAFVLFERDGKLYEVHGGHCSCFGLEGQWDPEETSEAALRHRMKTGYEFNYVPKDARKMLKKILKDWKV